MSNRENNYSIPHFIGLWVENLVENRSDLISTVWAPPTPSHDAVAPDRHGGLEARLTESAHPLERFILERDAAVLAGDVAELLVVERQKEFRRHGLPRGLKKVEADGAVPHEDVGLALRLQVVVAVFCSGIDGGSTAHADCR